jgi:Mg-chelatase subunit ChlD
MTENRNVNEGKVGTFWNNQVLGWDPLSFTIEFIYRMRKLRKRLLNLPSTRQAIAIPKLMTAMYYRKVNLIPDDYIKAAVITTPIEDQEIARKVAFEILFNDPDVNKKPKQQNKRRENVVLISDSGEMEEEDFMDDLLSEIVDSGIDMQNMEMDELLDQTLEEFSNLTEFVDLIYEKAGLNEEPYQSLIDIIERRDGYKELLGRGISTLDQLNDYVHQMILREMNVLSPQDITSAVNLNWGEDLINQATNPWTKASAMYQVGSPDFKKYLQEVMDQEEVATAARTARYLQESGMDRKEAEKLTEKLIERASNIVDISEIAKVMDNIPKFDRHQIINNSLQRDVGSSFRISRQLDKNYNDNLTQDMFEEWAKQTSSPSLPELFQAHVNTPKWKQMIDEFISRELNQISNTNGRPAYNTASLARSLMNLSQEVEYTECAYFLQEKASYVGMEALRKSIDSEQFKNVLETLLNSFIQLNEGEVINLAKKLGVPEDEVVEILGGNYELLKSLISEKAGNFQRYTNVLNNIPFLSGEQVKELLSTALQAGNFQAMGALGHYNLGQAFQITEQMGGTATIQLSESLSAGPGDNLLLQWFTNRDRIPAKAKGFVRNLVKDALIKIALNMISNQRGSGEKGLVPTNKLRIFIDGDDMDLIDVDASIENIVMQGKTLDMIIPEDLLVMETEKGRVSICFLLDISGSMTGMKLAACSIAVMVLIGALRAEEVAICFFESNTHVVKEFGDVKDLEDVADELLDLKARGGTQVQKALEWGARQLEETNTELKVCFLLTDCEFFEKKEQIVKELDSYVNQKVEFLLGVNTRSYSKKYAEWILDSTQGKIVYILNIMDIPKILTEVLEQIG